MTESKARILLLETDEANAARLEALLLPLGHDFEHCIHPHEALFTVSSDPPDIVLLSSPLARVTTAAFLANLQSVKTSTPLFLVALLPTGLEYDLEVRELMQKGLDDCLRKPVQHGELVVMLARWARATNASKSSEATSQESPNQSAAFAAIEDAMLADESTPAPEADISERPKGPLMRAQIDGVQHTLYIEMLMGESIMAVTEQGLIAADTVFGARLAYRDPAPGRNRMIELKLQLRVGSCTPAEAGSYRCSLKVEEVRPSERWNQFVRVARAALKAQEDNASAS